MTKLWSFLSKTQWTYPDRSRKDGKNDNGTIHKARWLTQSGNCFVWDFRIHISIIFPPMILEVATTADHVLLRHTEAKKLQTNRRNLESE